jgi:hypothetical protein
MFLKKERYKGFFERAGLLSDSWLSLCWQKTRDLGMSLQMTEQYWLTADFASHVVRDLRGDAAAGSETSRLWPS